MNRLPLHRRAQVVQLLAEGMSMRTVERVTGTSYDAIASLLVAVGKACKDFHDLTVRNIKAQYIQCDEVFGFCYSKQKNVPDEYQDDFIYGTNWTAEDQVRLIPVLY